VVSIQKIGCYKQYKFFTISHLLNKFVKVAISQKWCKTTCYYRPLIGSDILSIKCSRTSKWHDSILSTGQIHKSQRSFTCGNALAFCKILAVITWSLCKSSASCYCSLEASAIHSPVNYLYYCTVFSLPLLHPLLLLFPLVCILEWREVSTTA